MENWNQVINDVLLTGCNYVHNKLTIKKGDDDRSIYVLTITFTKKITSKEAEEYLEKNFVF